MSTRERPLLGSVFERTAPRTPSMPSSRLAGVPETGFPTAQYRQRVKSAFARAQDEASSKDSDQKHADVLSVAPDQPQTPMAVAPTSPIVDSQPIPTDTNAVLRQIHGENARRIAQMSDNEIEQEKRAILEQLGEGTSQLLRRVQEARRRKEARGRATQGEVKGVMNINNSTQTTENDDGHMAPVTSPTPRRVSDGLATKPGVLRVKSLENLGRTVSSPLPATSSTRPSSRTSRRLRFAEVTPDDVHVYESAPTSPKRTILALPPPPETKDDSVVSLGMFRKDVVPFRRPHSTEGPIEGQPGRAPRGVDELEEGSPEYIRRRYFPEVPADDTSLAWMKAPSLDSTDSSIPRFDLHGAPIPALLSASLPSYLGLHHHAEGARAGYTIDDIFFLARSTVPAQRASMLGILAKIARRLGRQVRQPDKPEELIVFAGQEGALRKRILAAGLTAIDQIGSLGAQAVEVVWECLVEWDGATNEPGGIELARAPDVLSSLPLDYFLPQITDILSAVALPSESLAQLLGVLHWLARQSNQVANMITSTPHLIPTILNIFLLTPIPVDDESVLPDPLVIQILITLASASRSNALALLNPADALLRFVTLLPPSSPYPPALTTTLLTCTLRFYTTLASYGFYSHIATMASEIFANLASYIHSNPSSHGSANISDSMFRQLCIDWTTLLQAWTVCATDPHATSPPHDILWSQVCAWGWAEDVRKLRRELVGGISDWPLCVAIWGFDSVWLEGSRINGFKGGEEAREEASRILRGAFEINDGIEFGVVQGALEAVRRDLQENGPTTIRDAERVLKSLASASDVLASALHLWLACLPPLGDGVPLSAPPFALPWSELSALSAALAKHTIWSVPATLRAMHLRVYLRPITRFLIHFHRSSRHIPGTTPQLWFAQALVFLSRLLPGDESHALSMLESFALVTPQFAGVDPARLPQNIHVDILRPFFEYVVWPERDVYVAPLRPNTESISRCSTLRLLSAPFPSTQSPGTGSDDGAGGQLARTFAAGLPLTCDFLFTPLTHLLRSGTSPIFCALPDNWTASEVDVVRATLLLAYTARRVSVAHGLEWFAHSTAEVVFACMRVCMLEHGVGGVEVEVFRDPGVERLMEWLLEPFTVRGRAHRLPAMSSRACTLEDASKPYLGATPFYQFYTDLVALYGAVSFGHRTFAALVVSPLAMHYAVDYRRALWCGGDGGSSGADPGQLGGGGGEGLGDVVKSVRIPIEDLICTGSEGGDPREYLYPTERDIGVLGAYVAVLVTRDGGGAEDFSRLVAVHHVACTMWKDLGADVGEGEDDALAKETTVETKRREEMRARLLKAVLVRGEPDVVRDIALYRQRQPLHGAFVWPPTCYRGGEDERSATGWREERLAFVRRAMGEGAAERVRELFTSTT